MILRLKLDHPGRDGERHAGIDQKVSLRREGVERVVAGERRPIHRIAVIRVGCQRFGRHGRRDGAVRLNAREIVPNEPAGDDSGSTARCLFRREVVDGASAEFIEIAEVHDLRITDQQGHSILLDRCE